jgi:putative membrane protein
MSYNTYFWGMHMMWWLFWLIVLFWLFITPYDLPMRRGKKETPLDILKRRFAEGQIAADEYDKNKKILLNS